MNSKKFISNRILKEAFGWSWKAWSHSFFKIEKGLLKKLINDNGNILEIGCSNNSQLGIIFKNARLIELGYFSKDKEYQLFIEKSLKNKYKNNKKIKIVECDFKKLNGKYSTIVMKSVLGGIYRTNNSKIKEVKEGIKQIIKNNLLEGGYLITLDNGYGCLFDFTKKFGARANKWRFFEPDSLKNEFLVDQVKFGFFSNLSFQSRLPIIGEILDLITFYLDKLFYSFSPLQKYFSSIIVTVYKRD